VKAFTGWRAAGRAMRWARRQEGICITRDRVGTLPRNVWRLGRHKVAVLHGATYGAGVNCRGGGPATTFDLYTADAVELLWLLSVLQLVPREQVACSRECKSCGGAA
jgi:hypothetical protein